MTVDIMLKDWNVALEYQGEGHFFDLDVYRASQALDIDAEKAVRCGFKEITLIEVPYWWNERDLLTTLRNTINIGPNLPIQSPQLTPIRVKGPYTLTTTLTVNLTTHRSEMIGSLSDSAVVC